MSLDSFSIRILAVVGGGLLVFSGVVEGQTAVSSASSPMGFYKLDLAVGYQTVGVSVVNPAIYGSWIGSSAGSTVTAEDGTVDVGGMLQTGKAYYLEIVEGPTGTSDVYVGQRFEVDVATTKQVGTADGVVVLRMGSELTTWVNSPPTTPNTAPELGGYRFELRAHVTLGQVFDPAALYGSTSFSDADQIQIFNGSGFTIYYILGDNSTFAQWTKQSGGDFSSKNDLPIEPGQGLIYKRSALSSGTVSMRVQGVARVTPFVQPLKSGYNFLSEAFPASHSFESRGAYPGGFNNLDRVQIYNGSGFQTYQLYTDGVSTHLWVDLVDPLFTSRNLTEVFDFRGAVFVDLDNATPWYRVNPPYAP